ncbi:ATP-binding protein [Aestuariibius insulae]|uniref:ATP-binding protein n=1 Tax=Aestuariibius insulae TaxID=2058287 RepID=UPI00345ECBAA
MLRRIWPDGIGARLALLLAAILVAANFVALALLSLERDRLDRQARAEREVERAASLVPALEAVARNQRDDIARLASTRRTRLRVQDLPRLASTSSDRRSNSLRAALENALPGRTIRASVRPRKSGHSARDVETVIVSIALSDPGGRSGNWLNLVSSPFGSRVSQRRQQDFVVALGLSLLGVLGATLLITRRMTRPLGTLADAAQAAGRGDRSARVPERGPREVREAAIAFNDMQSRVARFESERMRTMAAVGHDLRTPITSLRIRAEMLAENEKGEAAAEAKAMLATLGSMEVMADGLVTYARDTSDAEPTRRSDLASFLSRIAKERGATLGQTTALDVDIRPVAVTRAVGNLIDNAIRYAGTATVSLTAEGGEAVIAVEDQGPGISKAHLTDITEPFVRGEASRSAETGGSGLGLAIARAVAESHGGTLRLVNRAEGGLRAELRLPRQGR